MRSGGWVRDLDSHPVEGRIEAEQIIACVDRAWVASRWCRQRCLLRSYNCIIELDCFGQFPIDSAAYVTVALMTEVPNERGSPATAHVEISRVFPEDFCGNPGIIWPNVLNFALAAGPRRQKR